MSLTDEDEFQFRTLVTPMFNVRAFPSCVVFTCSFCHGIGHELGSCLDQSNQMLPSEPIFIVPPNITLLPQLSILVHVSIISTILVVPNLFGSTTNPFNFSVPT
jgi:hypothetical protein